MLKSVKLPSERCRTDLVVRDGVTLGKSSVGISKHLQPLNAALSMKKYILNSVQFIIIIAWILL